MSCMPSQVLTTHGYSGADSESADSESDDLQADSESDDLQADSESADLRDLYDKGVIWRSSSQKAVGEINFKLHPD